MAAQLAPGYTNGVYAFFMCVVLYSVYYSCINLHLQIIRWMSLFNKLKPELSAGLSMVGNFSYKSICSLSATV